MSELEKMDPRILGGRIADGVMLDFIHKPDLAAAVSTVRTHRSSARVCYSTTVVTDADDLEFVRPHMTYRLVDAPEAVQVAIGLDGRHVDQIRSAMAEGLEVAARLVRDEWILPFVIEGSSEECAKELGRLMEQNDIEEFVVPMFAMPDQAGYLARVASVLDRVDSHSG